MFRFAVSLLFLLPTLLLLQYMDLQLLSKIGNKLSTIDTPFYLYDEDRIKMQCQKLASLPPIFNHPIEIRYAIKANANKQILKVIQKFGFTIDASSYNEARRALIAGFDHSEINYTTQEILQNQDELEDLFAMVLKGMNYCVCSKRQYLVIRDLAIKHKINLSLRLHPGVGSGESATRNTGDKYSCFGVHLNDLQEILEEAQKDKINFVELHVHIGSGGSISAWKQNIERELGFAQKYFKGLKKINFGGGLKIARMPNEEEIDLKQIGIQLERAMNEYYKNTGEQPIAVIEPGTFIIANCGYAVTKVIDRKQTGEDGFDFIIANGGMEINTRPLLYGSMHPFYLFDQNWNVKSSEFDLKPTFKQYVVVGRCCQSGDSQSLDNQGHILPRRLAEPAIGDFLLIGGAGAYCSSMSPFNYNSHVQVEEILINKELEIKRIRKRQTLQQIIVNETLEQL